MTKHTQKLDLRNSMNSENEVPIQHTYGDCVKICDQRHNSGTYWHKVCKHWCNNTNFSYSQPHSQEVTLSEKLASYCRQSLCWEHKIITYGRCNTRSRYNVSLITVKKEDIQYLLFFYTIISIYRIYHNFSIRGSLHLVSQQREQSTERSGKILCRAWHWLWLKTEYESS